MSDLHQHKCNGCSHIWEHGSENRGNVEAHTCTNCGQQQWAHYDPNELDHIRAVRDLIAELNRIMMA